MEPSTNLIDPLIEKADIYCKTSYELLKLKALSKGSEVGAGLISRSILILFVSIFTFTLSIAIALWLGDQLGRNYYGFLIVAGFYAIASLVVLAIHAAIRKKITNSIIRQLFN